MDRSPVGACAGHSLGEYSALTATQALALSDSALLLHIRGRAMHQALPEGAGAMAAVLNMTPQTLQPLIDTLNQPDCVCELANDNGPGQCIVSGHRRALAALQEVLREKQSGRLMFLNVSTAFHCSLMEPVACIMARALEKVPFKKPLKPLVTNSKALMISDPAILKKA